jgi:guanine deaminase
VQTSRDQELLRRAIELARASAQSGGGPFGAVVAQGERVLAEGTNRVTASHDPTAHAEIVAIRAACRALGDFQLAGCTIYASCEPCPMCLGAIYWSRAERLVFACTRTDAAAIGFDDDLIYRELALPHAARKLSTEQILRDEGLSAFRAWTTNAERREY